MRKDPTQGEKVALALLDRALTARGTRPMYALEVTDSPDALFLVEGRPIAIECRYIAHPKLLELRNRRDVITNVPYEVVVPREPHLWVRNAIIEKNKNIKKYMENTGATEAWLLVHSSPMHTMLSGDEADEVFKALLAHGTQLVEHGFTRIWFAETGGEFQDAFEIYGPDIEPSVFYWKAYVAAKFTPRYPIDTFWYMPVFVEDDGSGSGTGGLEVNFNETNGKPIGFQPLDTDYRLDYSGLSDPLRNANRAVKWTYYQNKPEH